MSRTLTTERNIASEDLKSEAVTLDPILSVHSVGTSRMVNPARLSDTSRLTSKAKSAIVREEWIFSTAVRRTTLHGHCVSLICIQNKDSTMTWKQRLVNCLIFVCS